MANERLETLNKARARLVADRHALASELAQPFERGTTDVFRKSLVEVQAAIAALDEAIREEDPSNSYLETGLTDRESRRR